MRKKHIVKSKRNDIKYLTSNRISLDDWNDNHILAWILDTEKNDFRLRKFLVSYFLWRHRNSRIPIHLYGGIDIVSREKIKKEMKFWVGLFKERNLTVEKEK